MLCIDLNCDLGEEVSFDGISAEALIMPFISSANIACGKHAGNEETIRQTILLAKKHGVAVGAHPSYDDRKHFGRKSIKMNPKGLAHLLKEQLVFINYIAESQEVKINHVKAHGALYNDAMEQLMVAETLAGTIAKTIPGANVFGLPGSVLEQVCVSHGLAFVKEAFADRAYDANGKLVPRSVAGAVISQAAEVIGRCLQIVLQNRVKTIHGNEISIIANTICIHGDGADAPKLAKALHKAFTDNGIKLKAYGSV